MKHWLIAFSLFFISFSALANKCAFRISGGELIRCGMSKIEVMNHLGQPELTSTESLGVNDGFGHGGQTVESWSYVAVGDIGGEYYLTVRFAESKVIGIESEQVNR
ncbi:DUF2845 domain-containing protein [Pseudidiomarina donghaiensis]|uniref:DUF2845 domain-containing protein n=1 Tax=Pseudidiomarina donghaiensis TaxID=519452 RepID=A0A432XLR4_9GAMM|nr:DUF2845 domain-containing protein [Pseudidiomarina donghaiensis]RUO49636.1 DUF2845 domain-containing protein [Pseudidiomarina donghaiensis]SFV21621.1 Protein of unknown function [Pseudidiomarina donghaiensis]